MRSFDAMDANRGLFDKGRAGTPALLTQPATCELLGFADSRHKPRSKFLRLRLARR